MGTFSIVIFAIFSVIILLVMSLTVVILTSRIREWKEKGWIQSVEEWNID